MKKLFVLAVAVALVAAACNKGASTQTQTQTQTPPASSSSDTSASGSSTASLAQLMAGGSQLCPYTDGANSGTVYVDSGKSRVDVTATANGKTTNIHSIMMDQTKYTWIDGQAAGFKMSLAASGSASGSGSSSPAQQGQVDPNKQMNYHCSRCT